MEKAGWIEEKGGGEGERQRGAVWLEVSFGSLPFAPNVCSKSKDELTLCCTIPILDEPPSLLPSRKKEVPSPLELVSSEAEEAACLLSLLPKVHLELDKDDCCKRRGV